MLFCDLKTTAFENKKFTIAEDLRYKLFSLNSKEYEQKMKIVDFLNSKGVNYKATPIPEYAIEKAKKDYPDSWQEYLDKY